MSRARASSSARRLHSFVGQHGTVLGTAAYMSLEQAEGKPLGLLSFFVESHRGAWGSSPNQKNLNRFANAGTRTRAWGERHNLIR